MNENDSGPASLAGGFKTIISMSLVAVVDGALCFVNQSQFVRLSVAEGSRRFESRRDVGSRRRVSAGARRGDEGEHRERDKKRRWNIKRETVSTAVKEGGRTKRWARGGRSKSKEARKDAQARRGKER